MKTENKQEINKLEKELLNLENQIAVLKRKKEKNPEIRIDFLNVGTKISSLAGERDRVSFEKKFYEAMERSGIDKLSLERDMPDVYKLLRFDGFGLYVDLNRDLNLGAVIYLPQERALFSGPSMFGSENGQRIKVFEIGLPEDAKNREKRFKHDDGRIIKEYFLKQKGYLFDKIGIESIDKECIDIMLEGRKIPTYEDIIKWEIDSERYRRRFRLPAERWREENQNIPVPYELPGRKERVENRIISLGELKRYKGK